MPSAKWGRQSVSVPVLHKGGSYAGPSIAFALRTGDATATGGPRRPKWDGRHHLVRQNDSCDPNTRCYFDRFVDRVQYPDCLPKVPLKPTFRLDCEPEDGQKPRVHRTWDAWHARWVDQWQWAVHPDVPVAGSAAGTAEPQAPGLTRAQRGPKTRSPRRDADLLVQREREKEWDSKHHAVFSRANDILQPNYRSYFDRWKEDNPAHSNPVAARTPSWRLPLEKKPLLRNSSAPKALTLERDRQRYSLPGQQPWNGNFNSRPSC